MNKSSSHNIYKLYRSVYILKNMQLNTYSQQIMEYMKTLPIREPPNKFSNKTKTFLTSIFHKIHEADKHQKYANIKSIKSPTNYESNNLFSAIPIEIREKILEIVSGSPNLSKSWVFEIKGRVIEVHLLDPNNQKHTKQILRLIYMWFYVAISFSNNQNCGKTIQLYLYFMPELKVLPNNFGEPITQLHANTAFTWACVPNSTIQIFREEEWFKVLIHETFHTLGMDFSRMNVEICRKKIRQWFSIDIEGLMFETYSETWACLLNSMFVSYFATIPRTQIKFQKMLENTETIMYIETKYAIFQSVKVLRYNGFTYRDIITPSDKLRTYHEETNIFCYNVLKALVLFRLDDFLEWCNCVNNSSFVFTQKDSNILKFCDFLENIYKDSLLLANFDEMEKIFQQDDSYVYKTMRMTIFG